MTKKRPGTGSEDKTTNVGLGDVDPAAGDQNSMQVTFGAGKRTVAAARPGAQAGATPIGRAVPERATRPGSPAIPRPAEPAGRPGAEPAAEEPMARPFEFSQDDDVEPTRQVQVFSERLAYWDAHDAEFSTADAEDELPLVLSMRKR